MIIHPMAAEKFHADSRQTHKEANKRFSHFCQCICLASDHKTGKSVSDTLTLSHMYFPFHTPMHIRICVCILTAIEGGFSRHTHSINVCHAGKENWPPENKLTHCKQNPK
jgi:hypothetical protein